MLDILSEKNKFRRYSTNIVILDVIPEKNNFRRYSTKLNLDASL